MPYSWMSSSLLVLVDYWITINHLNLLYKKWSKEFLFRIFVFTCFQLVTEVRLDCSSIVNRRTVLWWMMNTSYMTHIFCLMKRQYSYGWNLTFLLVCTYNIWCPCAKNVNKEKIFSKKLNYPSKEHHKKRESSKNVKILTDPYGYGFSLHPVPSSAGWARNACVWFLHHNSRHRSYKEKI